MELRTAAVAIAVAHLTVCATVTAKDAATVPVEVTGDGARVEVDGHRQPAPAVVHLPDARRAHRITVGSRADARAAASSATPSPTRPGASS